MATLVVTDGGTSPEYPTLNAALAAAGPGDTISIEGTWSSDDTTAATVSDDNITITADADSQHDGIEDESTNHYRLVVSSSSHCITVNNGGCTIEKINIQRAGTTASAEAIRVSNSGTTTIKRCILRATTATTQQDGIYTSEATTTITVENTIIIRFGRGGIHNQQSSPTSQTITIDSCTLWDNGSAAESDGGGILMAAAANGCTCDIDNTMAFDHDNQASQRDYRDTGLGNTDWQINYCIDSDNSIATVRDSGANNLASRVLRESTAGGNEVLVNDITTAPYDLRLVDDTTNNDAQDAGATALTEDIAGTARPQNSTDDIGAFEVVAAGGGRTTKNTRSAPHGIAVGMNWRGHL